MSEHLSESRRGVLKAGAAAIAAAFAGPIAALASGAMVTVAQTDADAADQMQVTVAFHEEIGRAHV